MALALTLSRYVGRAYTVAALGMIVALTALVSLFDFIELLRRAAIRPEATFARCAEIAGLRLPWIMLEVLPFAMLLGGLLAFWRLTRSSELVVARGAGLSAWQFLAAPVVCAVGIGALAVAGGTPLSAVMRARAEALENALLRSGGGPAALTGGQLWLRQADRELTPDGVAIVQARGVRPGNDGSLTANEASVFRLDASDRLLSRIEAGPSRLEAGRWALTQARVVAPGRTPDPPRLLTLATDVTLDEVQDGFAAPDTLSVWALPGVIATLERSGFSALRQRLHFQSLLALPLLAGTMALIAAGFSMRPARRGGVAQMIGFGVAAGFALFVISRVAEQFGQSGTVPVPLAAWAPVASGFLLSVALLLHLEDG